MLSGWGEGRGFGCFDGSFFMKLSKGCNVCVRPVAFCFDASVVLLLLLVLLHCLLVGPRFRSLVVQL